MIVLLVTIPDTGAQLFGKKSDDEQRQRILTMREETLDRLYKEKPSAESTISNAVGYAVFSNTGVNVLLVSTANGKGVAHDNHSDQNIDMNMISAGGGIGLGVKKFSAVSLLSHKHQLPVITPHGPPESEDVTVWHGHEIWQDVEGHRALSINPGIRG